MTNILAVDVGYGFTKSYYSQKLLGSTDRMCFDVFPTVYTKSIPQGSFQNENTVITVDDERFLVGEAAQREGRIKIETRNKNFVGSKAYCAVLANAMNRTFRDPDILVLGLPPGYFSQEYCDNISGILKKVRITASDNNNIRIPKQIRFIPQGTGIFFSHVRNGGEMDFKKRVAIIDVGYHTLDVVFFVKGKFVENAAQSIELGVSKLYDRIRNEFKLKHRVPLKNDDTLDKLIEGGEVTIMGQRYAFDTKPIQEAYNAEVGAFVKSYLEGLPDDADVILAGGGGIRHTKIDNEKLQITIASHAQYANARGYFEYAQIITKNIMVA